MKNMLDSIFFIRLFVPRAPQTSPYRRAKSDIWLAIPPTLKRLRNGDSEKSCTEIIQERLRLEMP